MTSQNSQLAERKRRTRFSLLTPSGQGKARTNSRTDARADWPRLYGRRCGSLHALGTRKYWNSEQ